MTKTKFKQFGKVTSGFAFKSELFNNRGIGLPIIRIRDIAAGETKTFYSGEYEQEYIINKGDILIGMDGEFNIHKWKGNKALLNQRVCKITIHDKNIDLDYIVSIMRIKLKDIEAKTPFVTVKHLSSKKILDMEFEIPSLLVQKKISLTLEKADQLKTLRQEADDLTNQFLQSLFIDMFGDPVKNPKKWPRKKLSEVSEVVSGSTPDTNNSLYWDGKINWITPAELIDGDNYYYSETERKISELGSKSIGARLFPVDTVMLTTRAPIGKVAIAGNLMCSNQGFKSFICNKEVLNHIYLYVLLLSKKEYLNGLGTGATFKEINKKTVESIQIPVPPIELQNKFAKIAQQIEETKQKQSVSKEKIEEITSAITQKAFAGEIA